MLTLRLYDADGNPYLMDIGGSTTASYGRFVSGVCDAVRDAIEAYMAPGGGDMDSVGRVLLDELWRPYADALTHEYALATDDGSDGTLVDIGPMPDREATSEYITQVVTSKMGRGL